MMAGEWKYPNAVLDLVRPGLCEQEVSISIS
jgi:hypothetical protein